MRAMILSTHPAAFAIIGIAIGAALILIARRRGKRSLDITRCVLAILITVCLLVDFIVTPADRLRSGIALALISVVWVVALSYQRFRGRPKAGAGQ